MQRRGLIGLVPLLLLNLPIAGVAGWSYKPAPGENNTPVPDISIAPLEQPTLQPEATVAPAESAGLEIIDAVMARDIVNQQPVGSGTQFPNNVLKLYCYTDTLSGKSGEQIIHRWRRDDQIISEIVLPIKRSPYRTWSSKNILPDWLGKWSVEIESNGRILKTLYFEITNAGLETPAVKKKGWAQMVIQIDEAVIAQDVKQAEPIGVADRFPASIGKIYCYTRLSGTKPGDMVIHRWIWKGSKVDEIPLTVKRNPARTWSTKTMGPDFKGEWMVEIVVNDEVIRQVPFILE